MATLQEPEPKRRRERGDDGIYWDKLKGLHEEINAGIRTPATYIVKECVSDWLDGLTYDPHTMATYRGQAEKWIYPRIGGAKLKDFKVDDVERFFRDLGQVLSKR